MKTISILGCGWLGLPLAKALLKKGFRIKGSTTSASKFKMLNSEGIEPFVFNLNEKVLEVNKDFFACDILVLNFPPKRIDDVVNVYSAQIGLCEKEIIENKIGKVLFVSSTSVYPNTGELVKELDVPKPDKLSGIALLQAENTLRNIANTQSTILRVAGLIGEDRVPGKRFISKNISMNGGEKVNLVHRDDCIDIIQQVIEQGVWGEIFNVCADIHPLKKELYAHTSKVFGFPEPKYKEDQVPDFKIIDNQLLKERLNYNYIHPDPLKIY